MVMVRAGPQGPSSQPPSPATSPPASAPASGAPPVRAPTDWAARGRQRTRGEVVAAGARLGLKVGVRWDRV